MKIRIIDNADEFALLKEPWDHLLSRSGSATVFNSWEWNYFWWKHYGDSRTLRILTVLKDNQIVAIAPFFLETIGLPGPFSLVILQLLGSCEETSPDYLDMLCDPEHETTVGEFLASHVLNNWGEWDVLKWTDMPEDSLLHKSLIGQNNSGLHLENGICSRISQMTIPASWDDFMSRFNKRKRYKIRSRRRQIETNANGKFFVWEDGNTLDEALDTLIQLHHSRMENRTRHCAFSTNAFNSFHRDIMHAFHARDWLLLYCIKSGDKVIAMDYCYRFKGRILNYQGGFDSSYCDLSPGYALTIHSFEHAVNSGEQIFDFLKGDYKHKRSFETHAVNTVYLTVYRNTLTAQCYRLWKLARKHFVSMVKTTRLGALIKKFRREGGNGTRILAG